MEPGFYKMVNGELLYGTKISSPQYTLTTKDKTTVDGWVWYDKPPVAEVTLPCGCCIKMLINPAVETKETAQAEVDVIGAKVIEGVAPKVADVSVVAEEVG